MDVTCRWVLPVATLLGMLLAGCSSGSPPPGSTVDTTSAPPAAESKQPSSWDKVRDTVGYDRKIYMKCGHAHMPDD